MQPSTSAILVIAGAVAVDCLWIAWESWREKLSAPYAGYAGPAGFIPRSRLPVNAGPYALVFDLRLTGTVQCLTPPSVPLIVSNVCLKGPPMAQRIITVQTTPTNDPSVTSQMVTATGSTVAGQNPVIFDNMLPGASFLANDGDVLIETAVNVNSAGPSPASPPVYVVVAQGTVPASATPPPPPVVVPLPPQIVSNTCT